MIFDRAKAYGQGGMPLTAAVKQTIPTPTASDHHGRGGGSYKRHSGLDNFVKQIIPTPTLGDAKASGSRNTTESKAHPGVSLTDFVREDGGEGRRDQFVTPSARDWKDCPGMSFETTNPDGTIRERIDLLPRQVYAELAEIRRESPDGGNKTLLLLNPLWVEWLMAYPIGFSDLNYSAIPSLRQWPFSWEK
jgi:hypothetical protein